MPPTQTALLFPGRVVAIGSFDSAIVFAIQRRLNQIGCGPVEEDGVFGADTMEAVEVFQVRSIDAHGQPLVADGRVGPATWAALFGDATVEPVVEPPTLLAGEVLRVAGQEVGVMETPPGSNRGPRVNEYLASVGLNAAGGSYAWCAAFVYWCFHQAAAALGRPNPAVCTAGALDVWNEAGAKGVHRVDPAQAAIEPGLVQPGMVFVISTGGGHGHLGLVEKVTGVVLTTIEGNTNDNGSRDGVGVFRRTARRTGQINRGFVDYA